MVKGSGSNEIIWDDSTSEQRIHIASDHAASALNQGYLVHPRSEGKGEPRGEGFELRTDAYGALRAAKGLLITADARKHARSTHLDSKELTTQLAGSIELAKALSDAAQSHNAHPLEANSEAERLQRVAQATTTQHGGTGQQATVPAYQDPILAFSSPAGIVSATPKTQQIAAGEHLHLTSQQDTNLAVGKRLAIAVKEAWSVFVATSGIKLFAGKGKVEIQAQGDSMKMTAKQDVKITSVDGEVDIVASKEIFLTAGGCQIKLSGDSIDIKAPGPVNIHGSVKNLTGPASVTPTLPNIPQAPLPVDPEKPLYSQQFDLSHLAHHDGEISFLSKGKSYSVYDKEGNFLAAGTVDEKGLTDRIFSNESKDLLLFVDEGNWQVEEFFEDLDDEHEDTQHIQPS